MSERGQMLLGLASAPHSVHRDVSKHQWRVLFILRHLSKAGATLQTASGKKYLGLKPDTLKRYCRKEGICFPDYRPRAPR